MMITARAAHVHGLRPGRLGDRIDVLDLSFVESAS